ncbi:MAG: triose-phosphate isomerase [Pseudomonadota bacterium]
MRKALIAANWKMHGSLVSIAEYGAALQSALFADAAQRPLADVAVFPPAVFLPAMLEHLPGAVEVGVQDIGISSSGAHTGEIAAEMVSELGGRWAIVGHSERRLDQEEKDDLVATKAAAALRGGLKPIVCVGETLAEREAGQEIAVVERQLEAVLDRVECAALVNGAIGYEPVWAIGTGETATPDQAQSMHNFIRAKLAEHDAEAAAQIRVIYGGSVKPDNARELFVEEDIDGGLVGGASLDAEQFAAILGAAKYVSVA